MERTVKHREDMITRLNRQSVKYEARIQQRIRDEDSDMGVDTFDSGKLVQVLKSAKVTFL